MKTILISLIALTAVANVHAYPWSGLFKRDIDGTVPQGNTPTSNDISISSHNNSVCTHGERRCSNNLGGYNSTDLCNWNQWIRYRCPNGLRCVDNDWECVLDWQAEWISNMQR